MLFHGGVPGPRRKGLVQRFKQDKSCRLFLSTDAGGLGLNLQNAAVVVIMDQPWNPAVLEQRIGRVHRLGQHRPVRVVHLIAQGTVEHGMLSLIDFKRSMFAGVLDGGKDEVFLGGTKLKRFMESVERATDRIPDPMPTGTDADDQSQSGDAPAREDGPASDTIIDPAWRDVADAGLSLLDKLGCALKSADGGQRGNEQASPLGALVHRDEKTGEQFLKLPVPRPEAMSKIVELLGTLVASK